MSPPRYLEHPPETALAQIAECVWQFEGEASEAGQRIVPDGRCELIFHHGTPYRERDAQGAFVSQPRLLFAGQLTRPLHLRAAGHTGVTAIRFRPAGAWFYIGVPLDRFTDNRIALEDILGADDARLLLQALDHAPPDAHAAILQQHAARRMRTLAAPADSIVEDIVAGLLRGDPLPDLLHKAAIGMRSLQRRFRRVVGVPPRTLAAVLRFRRVFDAFHASPPGTWSAAAQEAGYFDHPQMARDFQRFVGCTPSQFVAAGPGLSSEILAG